MNRRFVAPVACVVVGVALLAAACSPPAPAHHLSLKVASSGAYDWQGQPKTADELPPAIEDAKRAHANLVIELDADPQAPMAAVSQAVQALRAGKVTVAFTHPPESLEQRTKAVGDSADIR